MTTMRLITEVAIAILYSAGAVFNTVYTLGNADKLYGAFADGAWLGPARRFLRTFVLPHATVFTVSLILFETAVAIIILTRGDLVRPALVAGAVFCVIAALVSRPGGTAGNLALAAIQIALAWFR